MTLCMETSPLQVLNRGGLRGSPPPGTPHDRCPVLLSDQLPQTALRAAEAHALASFTPAVVGASHCLPLYLVADVSYGDWRALVSDHDLCQQVANLQSGHKHSKGI